jgi:hypothetical protein
VPTSWSDVKTSPQIGSSPAGGGATVADFDANGTPDLLLLSVDNSEKHIYHYAIGWNIDSNGNPTSWSPIYEHGNRTATVFVPLVPVVDFGNNVALSGRMYFPEGYGENISINAELIWMVTGKTDDRMEMWLQPDPNT